MPYLPLSRGFVYVFAVLDGASRRVLAWRRSNTLPTDLCLDVAEPRWLAFGYIGAMGDRFGKYSASECTALWYGIESGHEKSRRSLGKSFTNEMVLEDISKTCEAGIWTGTGFIFGFPAESEEAFHKSISLASKLPVNSVC